MNWKCKLFGHKFKLYKVEKILYGVYDAHRTCTRCNFHLINSFRSYNHNINEFYERLSQQRKLT